MNKEFHNTKAEFHNTKVKSHILIWSSADGLHTAQELVIWTQFA